MMFGLYVALTLAALIMLGAASKARGFKLWLALFVFGWVVSQFNTLLEAVVFSVMPIGDALLQLGVALIAFAILAAIAVVLLGKWKGDPTTTPVALHLPFSSIAVIILGYEFLYWVAGTMVWPFVAHYYADKGLPAPILVAALQIPRALIFLAAAWLWLRSDPRYAPLLLGAAFAIIGGVAPMFPDNPYMPADVRLAHGIETSISNFLFGLLMGYIARR